MAGQPLDPAPFVRISNAASDLIHDIEICTHMGSLGQIFAPPSVLYVKPTPKPMPTPATTPDKRPRPSLTQNDDPEFARKRKKAEKEGWLKKLSKEASANLLTSQLPAAVSTLSLAAAADTS
jgi:hypothetical protein